MNSGCSAITDGVAQLKYLECIFQNVVVSLLGFAGLAFFVLFIVGGFQYLTGGTDPKKIEAAQGTLKTAFIGIIIIASAYLILRFIASITGVEGILNFSVTQ